MTKVKANYIKPEAEYLELNPSLNLLNSVSLGGTAIDWEEGEYDSSEWGDFVPYP